jgi:hypothetical protein
MKLITDIQVAYVSRMIAALKTTPPLSPQQKWLSCADMATKQRRVRPRTKSNRLGRTKHAAQKQAITRLIKHGYSAQVASQIVDDAHDIFLAEANSLRLSEASAG